MILVVFTIIYVSLPTRIGDEPHTSHFKSRDVWLKKDFRLQIGAMQVKLDTFL